MESNTQAPCECRKRLWAGRIMSALPVIALVLSASMKLAKPPAVVEGFAKFGYPENVIAVLGVVELLSAILYAIPRTSVFGAVLLTGFLGGATATHVRVGEPFIAPVILGVLVWGGLFLRDARLRALFPLRSERPGSPS